MLGSTHSPEMGIRLFCSNDNIVVEGLVMIIRALVAFQVLAAVLRLPLASARVVNRTIDDTGGDSDTGRLPLYLPSTGDTWEGASCLGCAIKADTTKAFKSTYTAATYSPDAGTVSITLTFNGTAIWVYFILANNEGDGITTVTDVNFRMDNESPTNFKYAPDLTTTELRYNQLVYSRTDLPFATHALEIFPDANFNVYVNFDYAIYTHDDDAVLGGVTPTTTSTTTTNTSSAGPTDAGTTTSGRNTNGGSGGSTTQPSNSSPSGAASGPRATDAGNPDSGGNTNAGSGGSATEPSKSSSSDTPVGAIAGGVIGGIAALAAIFLLVLCLRRRRRAQAVTNPALMSEVSDNRADPFVQDTFFHPRPSASGNEPLYSPVPNNQGGQFPASMTSGSQYSNSNTPYGGVGGSGYDSERAAALSASASAQSTLPSTAYNHGSSGARSEKRRRQGPVVLAPREQSAPSSTGAAHLSTVTDPDEQERIRNARQAMIGNRLRMVEREMNELGRGLKRGRSARSAQAHAQRAESVSDGRDDEIADMREEMRRMQEEIMLLRSNQASEWAQGLTDEPPPGYTPQPISAQPAP